MIITDVEKLRKKCRPVLRDTNMKQLYNQINKACELMIANKGVGLAANQIGSNYQFFVASIDVGEEKNELRYYMNPQIISHSETMSDDEEGCLSFPGKAGIVSRYDEITLKHWTRQGNVTETFSGLNARIIQHECDHLRGILCMDIAKEVYIKDVTESSDVDQTTQSEE